VIVAGRGIGRALLGSGLLAVTVLGGAGGYGIGLLTSAASEATGRAVPLGAVTPADSTVPTPAPTTTPTEPVKPRKTPTPDDSAPLRADDLSYQTREFDTEGVVRSRVTVKVPRNWWMTQPDPKREARFTDPTAKRWVRIESGFSLTRPPAASMEIRIGVLKTQVPADQILTILSQKVDRSARTATLSYTYMPAGATTLRFVLVRWAALDASGKVAVEMSSTGLPQDADALLDVLDHATASVTRSDSPL
jgi:hypothetical protein